MPRGRHFKPVNISSILKEYGEKAAQAAQEALQDNAKILTDEAKSRCPVDTGNLRNSIHSEAIEKGKYKGNIRVIADAKNEQGFCYAPIVEYSPKIEKRFMYPAMDAKREEIRNHAIDKIREAIRG